MRCQGCQSKSDTNTDLCSTCRWLLIATGSLATAVLVVLLWLVAGCTAHAQPDSRPVPVDTVLALMLEHDGDSGPCEGVEDCAELAFDIGLAVQHAHVLTGVPEDYLLAIGWLESGLDRTRHGTLGRGVWGLNPRSVAYAYALDQCNAVPDGCLAAQARVAARYLALERQRCGSWGAALRSYGSGQCTGSAGDAYVRRWQRALRQVRRAGGAS